MRAELDTFSSNSCKARIEFDTGGPVGSDHLVTVWPTDDTEDWVINRWFYFDEQNEHYMKNFAKKCLNNPEYRQASIDGETDWARVAEHYEPRERRLYELLSNYEASDYPIMNSESREDSDLLEDVCKQLFKGIKRIIRDGENTHPDALYNELEAELQEQLDEKYTQPTTPTGDS